MKTTLNISIFYFLLNFTGISPANCNSFILVDSYTKCQIVNLSGSHPLYQIGSQLLAEDINKVTGYFPPIINNIKNIDKTAIIISNIENERLKEIIKNDHPFYKFLPGAWEKYGIQVLKDFPAKNKKTLLIVGSDPRGTVYGIFHLSEKIGVSPWNWWGDVYPEKNTELILDQELFISESPSVQYRGIFLNDEDWGLQPWAAKTFEPETGDIGPKTYEKIFELLLRLKANTIWPAMHNCTKAFFHYPENSEIARKYAICVGTSHAEPMLRNNVDEWDKETMGRFNYRTNRNNILKYWHERVKQSHDLEAIYTMGIRGIHDSGMEGFRNRADKANALENVINDQRKILSEDLQKDIKLIPQVFTPYKEVLTIYDYGIQLPEDITIVWTDDNYGYIRRLSSEEEKRRSGGSGIYYHISYWGRPHDYLWLSTTHPMLIWEEMTKAYQNDARKIWIVNVGDIKPAEYNTEFFLDLAWNINEFSEQHSVQRHLQEWINQNLDPNQSNNIASLICDYYNLAFERRPEFMGWSTTEPTTQTSLTEYSSFLNGDEVMKRIETYTELESRVRETMKNVSEQKQDAFYQLVYYPVICASAMNKKYLYAQKATEYATQKRACAKDYKLLAEKAYKTIIKETDYYNNILSSGKWKHMMSFKPRNLPVFDLPKIDTMPKVKKFRWAVLPEGLGTETDIDKIYSKELDTLQLPTFNALTQKKYFIDIFTNKTDTLSWSARPSENWIQLSNSEGILSTDAGQKQDRIWISVDWNKAKNANNLSGKISFQARSEIIDVEINAIIPEVSDLDPGKNVFIEDNGLISINTTDFTNVKKNSDCYWQILDNLDYNGKYSIQSQPIHSVMSIDTIDIAESAPYIEYEFFTMTENKINVYVCCLPTHPINNNFGVRYAITIDDLPIQIIDVRTFGRSEEWKKNVLRNSSHTVSQHPKLKKGKHTLRIYWVDPGVTIQKIILDLGGLRPSYTGPQSTKIKY